MTPITTARIAVPRPTSRRDESPIVREFARDLDIADGFRCATPNGKFDDDAETEIEGWEEGGGDFRRPKNYVTAQTMGALWPVFAKMRARVFLRVPVAKQPRLFVTAGSAPSRAACEKR